MKKQERIWWLLLAAILSLAALITYWYVAAALFILGCASYSLAIWLIRPIMHRRGLRARADYQHEGHINGHPYGLYGDQSVWAARSYKGRHRQK